MFRPTLSKTLGKIAEVLINLENGIEENLKSIAKNKTEMDSIREVADMKIASVQEDSTLLSSEMDMAASFIKKFKDTNGSN